MAQEEILWNQKARQDWALLGDKNSSFFHKKTQARNYHNRVGMLKIVSINWYHDEEKLNKGALDFFIDLFTKKEIILPSPSIKEKFPSLNAIELQMLSNHITPEEVKRAVFEMGPIKALGCDG